MVLKHNSWQAIQTHIDREAVLTRMFSDPNAFNIVFEVFRGWKEFESHGHFRLF